MSPETFIAGILIGIILAAPVGPLSIICLHRLLNRGRLHGIVSGLGIATADTFYAGLVASGLSLIAGVLLSFQVQLRIVAGLALIFIGYRVYASPVSIDPSTRNGERDLLHEYSSMTVLTLANVLTILTIGIFLSGSGFVIGTESPTEGLLFASGVFTGETAWWFTTCSVIDAVNHRFNPGRLALINRISGAVIATAGIVMAFSVLFLLFG